MSEVIFNYVLDKVRRFHLSPGNKLSHIGTYTRELPISLDRMYENALDGEHLPYLHSSTFSYIDILDSGPWGWRARAGLQPRSIFTDMEIELVLNRDEYCWKTRTLKGLGKGTEIWTHAIPLSENRIKVIVDFYIPKVPALLRPIYADYYLSTYERLYDEDEQMMCQRQEALDFKQAHKNAGSRKPVSLGHERDVKAKIPFTFTCNGERFCLNESNGELVAYSAMCPHMLGPLDKAPLVDGVVECPWHAYRFDVSTGQCVSGQSCRLKPGPMIKTDPETREVTATA
ncbi:MAG: Rieske (2Fe-2S) protein [Ketobacteraceae bacterium]|nr:Rieske (2Fe-2S) protein [Ketobacteraceae bacterium]